jgi:hypothetical protein
VELKIARRAGARIAITGVAETGGLARTLLRGELDGVRVLAGNDELRDVDMLVFVAGAADAIDAERVAALAERARERGMLIAALVVSGSRHIGASPVLGALRDAADMVMLVRDPADVQAVVAALR